MNGKGHLQAEARAGLLIPPRKKRKKPENPPKNRTVKKGFSDFDCVGAKIGFLGVSGNCGGSSENSRKMPEKLQ
jgi:hypothetical protein